MKDIKYIESLKSLRQHAVSERRNNDVKIFDKAIEREKLVEELLKRSGTLTLTKVEEVEEIKLENMLEKTYFLEKLMELFSELINTSESCKDEAKFKMYRCSICSILKDYRNLNKFLGDGEVG